MQKAFHTLVLSAHDGEDGVWLEAAEDGLTRGVLIAGEPLQQPVVQVSRDRVEKDIQLIRAPSTDRSSSHPWMKHDRQ